MFASSFIWVFWKKSDIHQLRTGLSKDSSNHSAICLREKELKEVVFLYDRLLKTVAWPLLVTALYQWYTKGNLYRNGIGLPLFGGVQETDCKVTRKRKKPTKNKRSFGKCNSSLGASSLKGSKKHAHFPWLLVKGAKAFITHYFSKFA